MSAADPDDEPTWAERRERLRDAAIEAEYDTGVREETEEEAKRHIVVRLAIIALGSIVLLGGILMLLLPGPGIIGVIAGLGILATEVKWAERMLEYAKEKARVDQLKEQSPWVQAAGWVITIGAVATSIWWFFIADPQPELASLLPWNW